MIKKIPGELESEIPSNELSELLMEIKPYVRQANYSKYARGNSGERKILDYLLLYTEGEGVITIDNKNYNLSKNSLFMIPPNISHSFTRTDDINNVYGYIHFDMIYDSKRSHWNAYIPAGTIDLSNYSEQITTNISTGLLKNIKGKLEISNLPVIRDKIKEIAKIKANENDLSFIKLSALMLDLISEILLGLRNKKFLKYKHYEVIQEASYFLNKNAKKDIDFIAFERQYKLSASHFRKLFREIIGINPRAYHRKARIKQSCELLILSNYNISEIAYEVGFSNPYNFSRAFKDVIGVSPTIWLSNLKSKK